MSGYQPEPGNGGGVGRPAGYVSAPGLILCVLLVGSAGWLTRMADLRELPSGVVRADGLGSFPLIHDEATHANWSLQNAQWMLGQDDWLTGRPVQPREYDPVYHGPLNYYLVALTFYAHGLLSAAPELPEIVRPRSAAEPLEEQRQRLARRIAQLGASDHAARLPSAVASVLLCLLPLALAGVWGLPRSLLCSGLLLLCPPLAYFSRLVLYDVICLALELGALVLILRAAHHGSRRCAFWAGVLIIADLCMKPTSLLFLTMAAAAAVLELAVQLIRHPRWTLGRLGELATARNLLTVIKLATLLVVAWALLYSDFGTFSQHALAIDEQIAHWMAIHGQGRLAGSLWYHAVLLAVYCPLMLAGVLGGPWLALLGRNTAARVIGSWAVLSLLTYSWANEKGPWLVNHAAVPASLATGLVLAGVWCWLRGRAFRVLGVGGRLAMVGLVAPLLAYQAWALWHAVHRMPAWDSEDPYMSRSAQLAAGIPADQATPDRFELLCYIASTQDYARMVDRLRVVGRPATARIAVVGDAWWPLGWHLRPQEIGEGKLQYVPIQCEADGAAFAAACGGYAAVVLALEQPRGGLSHAALAEQIAQRLDASDHRYDLLLRAYWHAPPLQDPLAGLSEADASRGRLQRLGWQWARSFSSVTAERGWGYMLGRFTWPAHAWDEASARPDGMRLAVFIARRLADAP